MGFNKFVRRDGLRRDRCVVIRALSSRIPG